MEKCPNQIISISYGCVWVVVHQTRHIVFQKTFIKKYILAKDQKLSDKCQKVSAKPEKMYKCESTIE